jgi:xylulokinase
MNHSHLSYSFPTDIVQSYIAQYLLEFESNELYRSGFLMKYLLGVDFGGSSSKATLINDGGEIICSAVCEYPMIFPEVGWVEHNPEDIYNSLITNVRTIIEKSKIHPDDIFALALDAGTHIAVLLDENDNVIRPAIYWSDSRSSRQSQELMMYYDRIMEMCVNAPSPVWTLPQLMWLMENEPEAHKRIRRILFLKDYIRYRLTGAYVTDWIEAMGSMLMDVNTGQWDRWLCSLCGIATDIMPSIVAPDTIVGTVSERGAKETGLSTKTLVAAGATDTVMEVYASGAIKPGQATLKLATAGRICAITEKAYANPLLVTYKHIIPGLWYPGTATKTCAASLRWYRDVFGQHEMLLAKEKNTSAYKLIDEAAEAIPAGSDNLFFHPYLQGEITPYLDTDLRASFIGASSFHTKGHFNRAVMEGVAYSMRDCMNALNGIGIEITDTIRIIGGGSKSALWRQIVADTLNIPMIRVLTDDSSIGSAMLAGVAGGVFGSYENSVEICTKTGDMVYPDKKNKTVYDRGFEFYKRIHDALAPIYTDLANNP